MGRKEKEAWDRIAELMRIEEITYSMLETMGWSDVEKADILTDYCQKMQYDIEKREELMRT